MRIFEIIILVALFVRLVGYALPSIRRKRWIDLLPSLTVAFTVIHLVLEKYRWQMVPAYGTTLLLFFLSLRRIKKGSKPAEKRISKKIQPIIASIMRLLIFILIAALPILLPVFQLPEPTGPYPIGTTNLHLVDSTRQETFTPNPDDQREFMVKVWYPAQVEPDSRPDAAMEYLSFQYSHLSLVKTHAYQNAPVLDSPAPYPVLIFSHGLIGLVEQNLTQMEELASHGYVVFSIAHPYHSQATVFPDGRVVPVDLVLSNNFIKGISSTPAEYARYLDIWTDDTIFLMDELESIQSGERQSALTGKLDLARLGIFGMSFGGTTAVQVCAVDDRCQAGISLDSSLPRDDIGREIDYSLNQPFMFIVREDRGFFIDTYLDTGENTIYGLTVRETMHFNFTDLFLYSPVLRFTDAFGAINGQHMIKIINDYTGTFFDKHLKGEMSPLLDGPSPNYPEVKMKIQKP